VIAALLALAAHADPVAARAPVAEDLAIVAGAPIAGVGVGFARMENAHARLAVGVRWPAGTVELAVGATRTWELGGAWQAGAGGAVGVIAGPGVRIGHTLTPWGRVAREGDWTFGAQIAAPLTIALAPAPSRGSAPVGGPQVRTSILAEPFLGGRVGKVTLLAIAGFGPTVTSAGRAGALHAQGSVVLGVPLARDPQ
jgi:hypothetical protein